MRDRFQEDVKSSIGKDFESTKLYPCRYALASKPNEVIIDLSKNCHGLIGLRRPTEERRLDNGNTLYVYGQYWLQYQIKRTPCDIFLEVDQKNVVANAYSVGDGCYMPY